ncbi:hypothetical protein GQ43DRAFT_222616 [Delitschia confertaspora ATCC 74209]|uniref:Uncharacterized protein n=1 Tax=Delitschia confertaspora ATCC 74209 TaxID=1513339 RepID=A0A9P4JD46_9PLEO|nr:hypothetical protein GQ43DRAFT_222616 [Delitschia confertaspora ATCC 74209]
MEPSSNISVKEFLVALQKASKQPFPIKEYLDRLVSASHSIPGTSLLRDYFPNASRDHEDATFHGTDCSEQIFGLVASAAARGMALVEDQYGFHECVRPEAPVKQGMSYLARLMPALYGDHLDKTLGQQYDLKTLAEDKAFVEYFHKTIHNPEFFTQALQFQSAEDLESTYLLNVFFVNEYFANAGTFSPAFTLTADPNSKTGPSFPILLKLWCQLLLSQPLATDPTAQQRAAIIIASVSHIFAPDQTTNYSVAELTTHALPESNGSGSLSPLKEAVDSFSKSAAATSFRSLGAALWDAWDNRTQNFTDAIKSGVNSSVKVSFDPFGSSNNRPVIGFRQSQYKISFGDNILQFMEASRNLDLFYAIPDEGKRTRITVVNDDVETMKRVVGCFSPTTQVMTDTGAVPICQLGEGMRVLTRATPSQFGVVSDEKVEIPVDDSVRLFGFNQETPFFTANHVFWTTTGLRAIDPRGAKAENPHLSVGKLGIGHSVYYSVDGTSYTQVLIQSITSTPANCEFVYGVHLREGLRSYHANGYLVHLNYPEITIASIGKAIMAFQPEERLRLLTHIQELHPLLQRFGGTTVLAALEKQLTPTYIYDAERLDIPEVHSSLLDTTLSWSLLDQSPTMESPNLPELHVNGGVFYVDGDHCNQSLIQDCFISWSRPLYDPQGLWEHGFTKLSEDFVSGVGALFYSSEAQPQQIPWKTVRRFSCTVQGPLNYGVAAAGSGFTAAAEEKKEDNEGGVSEDLSFEAVKRPVFNVQFASLAVHSSENATESALPATSEEDLPPRREGAHYIALYDLRYNSTALPENDPDTVKIDPISEKDFVRMKGLFELGTVVAGQDQGTPWFDYRLPLLDYLKDVMASATRSRLATLHPDVTQEEHAFKDDVPELYESYARTIEGKLRITFEIKYAGMLAQAADGYTDFSDTQKEKLTFKNLTFKGLLGPDSSVNLPFVFSRMDLEYTPMGDSVQGYLWEYDHLAKGNLGKRHAIYGMKGEYVPSPPPPLPDKPNPSPSQPPIISPASIPSGELPLDRAELKSFNIDNGAVSEAAQRLIYKSMLYHMEEKDRNEFVGEKAPQTGDGPDNIPVELADSLETETKNWLKTRYTTAWIALRIIQTGDVSKEKWRRQFTSKEQSNIFYFWNGKGLNCLSRSGNYAKLNNLAVRIATLRMYPRLKTYMMDGGSKWAKELFDAMNNDNNIRLLCESMKNQESRNPLQKICNILQVLEPLPLEGTKTADGHQPYSWRLAAAVIGSVYYSVMKLQYLGGTGKEPDADEIAKFQNVLDTMMERLLSENDSEFGTDMAKMLREDLEQSVKLGNINRAEKWQFLHKALSDGAAAARYCRLLGLYRSISEISPATSSFQRASYAAEILLSKNKIPLPSTIDASRLRRCFVACGMVFITVSAMTTFQNWDALTPVQRAQTILQQAQAIAPAMRTMIHSLGSHTGFGSSKVPQFMKNLSAARAEYYLMAEEGLPFKARFENFKDVHYNNAYSNLNSEKYLEIQAQTNSKFNWRTGWFRLVTFVVGLGIAVCMTIDLFQNWSDRDLTINILNTIAVVAQWVMVIADGIVLLSLLGVNIWSGLLTFCAWAGPIALIIGIIIAIVIFLILWIRGPPLTYLEKWVDGEGVGGKWVKTLDNAPASRLTWNTTSNPGSNTFIIKGVNASDKEVKLSKIYTSFTSGGSEGTLFTGAGPFVQTSGTQSQPANTVALIRENFENPALSLKVEGGTKQQAIGDLSKTSLQWYVTVDAAGTEFTVPAKGVISLQLVGPGVNTTGDAKKFTVVVSEIFLVQTGDYTEQVDTVTSFQKKN